MLLLFFRFFFLLSFLYFTILTSSSHLTISPTFFFTFFWYFFYSRLFSFCPPFSKEKILSYTLQQKYWKPKWHILHTSFLIPVNTKMCIGVQRLSILACCLTYCHQNGYDNILKNNLIRILRNCILKQEQVNCFLFWKGKIPWKDTYQKLGKIIHQRFQFLIVKFYSDSTL